MKDTARVKQNRLTHTVKSSLTGPAKSLEELRKRLLDTTLRNPLLKCTAADPEQPISRSRRRIRLLAHLPALWSRLNEAKQCQIFIQPGAENGRDSGYTHLKTSPSKNLHRTPSIATGRLSQAQGSQALADGHLIMTCDQKLGDDLLDNLRRVQNRYEHETGDSAMFLAIGFLKWTLPSEDNTQTLYSPLLLVHITLSCRRAKNGRLVFFVESDGDAPQDNLTLLQKFCDVTRIQLPKFNECRCKPNEDTNITTYLQEVRQRTSNIHIPVEVVEGVVLGQFAYANYRMWLDLDPNAWPEGHQPTAHPIVRALLTRQPLHIPEMENGNWQERVAQRQINDDLLMVRRADSSQYRVIMDAVDGQSLVCIGPPGTGKSDTIVNTIAAALEKGQTVLFCAQKAIALEVVYHRLQEAGISDHVLRIFTHNAKTKDVINHITRALHAHDNPSSVKKTVSTGEKAKELNALAELLSTREQDGQSYRDIIAWAVLSKKHYEQNWGALSPQTPDVSLGKDQHAWKKSCHKILRQYVEHLQHTAPSWFSWRITVTHDTPLQTIEEEASHALHGIQLALASLLETLDRLQAPHDLTTSDLEQACHAIQQTAIQPLKNIRKQLLCCLAERGNDGASIIKKIANDLQQLQSLQGQARRFLTEHSLVDEASMLSVAESVSCIIHRLLAPPEMPKNGRPRLEYIEKLIQSSNILLDALRLYPEGASAIGANPLTWPAVQRLAEQRCEEVPNSRIDWLPALAVHLARHCDRFIDAEQVAHSLSTWADAQQKFDELGIPITAMEAGQRSNVRILCQAVLQLWGDVQLAAIKDTRPMVEEALQSLQAAFEIAQSIRDEQHTVQFLDLCELAERPVDDWLPPDDSGILKIIEACAKDDSEQLWQRVLDAIRQCDAARSIITTSACCRQNASNWDAFKETLIKHGTELAIKDEDTAENWQAWRDTLITIRNRLTQISQHGADWAQVLGISIPVQLEEWQWLAILQEHLAQMPSKVGPEILRLQSHAVTEHLRNLRQACEKAQHDRALLQQTWHLELITNITEISNTLAMWRIERRRWWRFMSIGYHRVKQTVLAWRRSGQLPDSHVIEHDLKKILDLINQEHKLRFEPDAAQVLGDIWRGVETNWNIVDETIAWVQSLTSLVGGRCDIAHVLKQPKPMVALQDLMNAWQQLLEHPLIRRRYNPALLAASLPRTIEACEQLLAGLQALTESARICKVPEHLPIGEWNKVYEAHCILENASKELQQLLPTMFESISTLPSSSAVETALSWYRSWRQHGWSRSAAIDACHDRKAISDKLRMMQDHALQAIRMLNSTKCANLHQLALPEMINYLKIFTDHFDIAICALAQFPDISHRTCNDLVNATTLLERISQIKHEIEPWHAIIRRPLATSDASLWTDTLKWLRHMRASKMDWRFIAWIADGDPTERIAWWRIIITAAREAFKSAHQAQAARAIPPVDSIHPHEVEAWQEEQSKRLHAFRRSFEVLERSVYTDQVTIQDIETAVHHWQAANDIRRDLWRICDELNETLTALTPELVEEHLRYAQATWRLPSWLKCRLMAEDGPTTLSWLQELPDKWQQFESARCHTQQTLSRWGVMNSQLPPWWLDMPFTIKSLHVANCSLQADLPSLQQYVLAQRCYSENIKLGLQKVCDLIFNAMQIHHNFAEMTAYSNEFIDCKLAIEKISGDWVSAAANLFDDVVMICRAAKLIESHPALRMFDGERLNSQRERFAHCEQQRLKSNAAQLRAIIAKRGIPLGQKGRTSDMTELALLDRLQGLQQPRITLRELLKRAGNAVRALCPCWLMTPAAIAQFLEPGQHHFDLVIFDEASQIPPEQALGALLRGSTALLVGDPKQMPPSRWFQEDLTSEPESLEDSDEISLQESILDAAISILPSRELTWHYRSQHQHLIAPANAFSYDNKLVVFPTPKEDPERLGIGWHFVPNGVFNNHVNAPEIDAIVEWLAPLLLEQAEIPSSERKSRGCRTIGVLTMNLPQQEALYDRLKQWEGGMFEDFLLEEEDRIQRGEEGFCIKNLENYQGDERDIMVLSFTYGPSLPGGAVPQRFGAINRRDGKRRFNVMITRARQRMEVFSSLDPDRSDHVRYTGSQDSGVDDMIRFLLFAKHKTLSEAGVSTTAEPESPFEEEVIRFLKEHGYRVSAQHGVVGYRIDIAVLHPQDPHRYVIGIECDGATYHSSRVARDRDWLREQVLKDRGWNLYRVWSTDWFRRPQDARQRLLNAVRDAIAKSHSQ